MWVGVAVDDERGAADVKRREEARELLEFEIRRAGRRQGMVLQHGEVRVVESLIERAQRALEGSAATIDHLHLFGRRHCVIEVRETCVRQPVGGWIFPLRNIMGAAEALPND